MKVSRVLFLAEVSVSDRSYFRSTSFHDGWHPLRQAREFVAITRPQIVFFISPYTTSLQEFIARVLRGNGKPFGGIQVFITDIDMAIIMTTNIPAGTLR